MRIAGVIAAVFLVLAGARPVQAAVVINEVLPNPTGTDAGNEWVELYNGGNEPVDLTGYELEDKTGDRFGLSGIIISWLVVYPQGGGFALTNTGSVTIKLFEPGQSEPVDGFDYDGSSEGKSWGRIPDGGGISSDKLTPTEGAANAPSTPTPSPTPTASPTPTPTATATSRPTATPTPPTPKATGGTAATPKPTATTSSVLAATIAAEIEVTPPPTAAATPQPEKAGSGKFAWLMIAGGGVLALAALFPFLRKWYYGSSWLKSLLKGGDRSSFGQE